MFDKMERLRHKDIQPKQTRTKTNNAKKHLKKKKNPP